MATKKKSKTPVKKTPVPKGPAAKKSSQAPRPGSAAKRLKKPVAAKAEATSASGRQDRAESPEKIRSSAPEAAEATALGGRRGLLVFGVIAALVLAVAVMGKLRQGPPLKLLPAEVLAVYSLEDAAAGPMSSPRGIALDSAGNLYVADLGNHRVVQFGPDGQMRKTWGSKGTAAGEFNEPSGVAVDQRDQVYVADSWNGRIQKFTPQGEYLGEIGAATGNFYSPRNVAVDTQGFIYVADTGNSCVKKFDSEANLVKRWGEYGTGHDRFEETFGLWVDGKNQVYVGDAGNRKLKVFSNEGAFIREIRVKGWQSGVSWPMAAVDSRGITYAVDVQHNLVWIYNDKGKYLGSWGNTPGKDIFTSPLGITVGPDGAVYVSSMTRGSVIKLKGLNPAP